MIGDKPKLRDVAKRAGVSLGTASNALNNRPNVSEEAKRRVFVAASELGYEIQVRAALTFPANLSVIGAIGKVTDGENITVNPFYSYVLAGIERECQKHGMSLMIANIEVDRLNRPVSLPAMLLDQQIDGISMVGTFLQDTIYWIERRLNKPLVLVDAYAPETSFDSVLIDNLNGAYAGVKYLLQQGHRHIGLVGSMPNGYPSIRERRKGYLRALKNHYISQSYIEDTPLTQQGGYEGAYALMKNNPQITAIFACNDEVALGAMEAARDLGRAIPDDVSIMGFDDIDAARQVTPALTTVRVDKVLLGMLAVRHLRDRAENPARAPLTTLVKTELIHRASVLTLNEQL